MEDNFDLELEMIYGNQLDSRGGPVLDDEVPENPVAEFFAKLADETSMKNVGVPSVATVLPEFDEIIGLSTSADTFVKSDPEPVEEIPLAKRSELSEEDREFSESRDLYRSMYS